MNKKINGSNQLKKIFSLNLICYLRCNGLNETRAGWNRDTKKVYFVFDESEELSALIEAYKDKDTLVKLHDFIAEFKKLKEDVYFYTNQFMKEMG